MSNDDFPFIENPMDASGGDVRSQDQAQEDEQTSEADMVKAISLVEQGQAIDQVISGLFANLPEHIKQQIRQKLQQAVQEKQARDIEMARETREKVEAKKMGLGKLFGLGMLSSVIAKETLEKIQLLFSQNPSVQQQVKHAGLHMLDKGVQPELEHVEQTPTMAPTVGVAQQKDREQSR